MKRFLFLIAIFFLTACIKDKIAEVDLTVKDEANIDKTNFVSKPEASNVAGLFFTGPLIKSENKRLDTKKNTKKAEKSIKSVETLFLDGSNDPAMYLINYNGGGFIIISATKTYYPILAYLF